MKLFIALTSLSIFTFAQASENLICGIMAKDANRLLTRVQSDLSTTSKSVIGDSKKLLSIQQNSDNFVRISIKSEERMDTLILDKEMLISMKKNSSLGFSTSNGNYEYVVCYNMKDEEMAPFDIGYHVLNDEQKLESDAQNVIQNNRDQTAKKLEKQESTQNDSQSISR
jgi:hypothetical protein